MRTRTITIRGMNPIVRGVSLTETTKGVRVRVDMDTMRPVGEDIISMITVVVIMISVLASPSSITVIIVNRMVAVIYVMVRSGIVSTRPSGLRSMREATAYPSLGESSHIRRRSSVCLGVDVEVPRQGFVDVSIFGLTRSNGGLVRSSVSSMGSRGIASVVGWVSQRVGFHGLVGGRVTRIDHRSVPKRVSPISVISSERRISVEVR